MPETSVKDTQSRKTRNVAKKRTGGKIYSFFNEATTQSKQRSVSPEKVDGEDAQELEDIVDDDSVVAVVNNRNLASLRTGHCNVSKKRPWDGPNVTQDLSEARGGLSGTPKFRQKKGDPEVEPAFNNQPVKPVVDVGSWTEQYAPMNLEELAVHKKKVSDVRTWLEDVLEAHSHKRLLVLKGSAGTGKTTTINLLSQVLKFEVLEWKNPAVAVFGTEDYISISSQFDDFILRTSNFTSLDIVRLDEENTGLNVPVETIDGARCTRQISLLEEYPANLARSNTSLQHFRSTILAYLAANVYIKRHPSFATRQELTPIPLVIIVSESTMSTGSNVDEHLSAQRLLGPEIINHLGTSVIEFNPVAPTFICKALNLVLQKHSNMTGVYCAPDPLIIKRLSGIGDLRNAIAALEFFCIQTSSNPDITVAAPKTRVKSRSFTNKRAVENATAELSVNVDFSLISSRESTLGLFHAVGKIVYNKRVEPSAEANTRSSAPDTRAALPCPETPSLQSSGVDVDTLMFESGTDTSIFLAALHENYVLSCFDPLDRSGVTLTTLNGCIQWLCEADLLGCHGANKTSQYASSECITQDALAFQVGVRGLLATLPYPVKRKAPNVGPSSLGGGRSSGKGRGDAHKLFYPMSSKLWRQKEGLQEIVDGLVVRAYEGSLLSGRDSRLALPFHNGLGSRGVVDTRSNTMQCNTGTTSGKEEKLRPLAGLGGGHSARNEMLLERLPYLGRIISSSRTSLTVRSGQQEDIERLTKFTGVDAAADDDLEDDKLEVSGATARRGFSRTTDDEGVVEKLVLSDDDIEDD